MGTETTPSNTTTTPAGGAAGAPPPTTPAPSGTPGAASTQSGTQGTTNAPAGTGTQVTQTGASPDATASDVSVKLPDGFRVDESALGNFKAAAKELGLKSEGAQKIFDLFVNGEKAREKQQTEQRESTLKKWAEELKADKDFGGTAYEQNLKTGSLAVEKFGNAGLRELLSRTGIDAHPDFRKFLKSVGETLREDSVTGARASPAIPKPTQEERLDKLYSVTKAQQEHGFVPPPPPKGK